MLAAFVSVASAQYDRELGITLKRNLPPSGQKVLDDAINTMSERGAVAVLAGPAENYNAQLEGSYGFSAHGTVASTDLQHVNPGWDQGSTLPTSYVGVMTLDRTGTVTRYRLTAGEAFGTVLNLSPTIVCDSADSVEQECGAFSVSSDGSGTLTLQKNNHGSGDVVHDLTFDLAVVEGGNHAFLSLSRHVYGRLALRAQLHRAGLGVRHWRDAPPVSGRGASWPERTDERRYRREGESMLMRRVLHRRHSR